MAFGGGTWLTQNKILPGTYINFVGAARASANLSDRGVAALPLPLAWGPEGEVFELTAADFQRDSLTALGYPFDAPEMFPLRELYKNAKTCYLYRLSGVTTKATCSLSSGVVATAKYGGARGNALRLVIAANVDDPAMYDVMTYMGDALVDTQEGVAAAADNAFVCFSDAALEATAGADFSGGTDGTVTGTAHQAALDKLESYAYNALGCVATDNTTKNLYVQYCKRMRDEVGAKFQLVLHKAAGADYEGVISVANDVQDPDKQALVYWVLGAQAGCEVNRSVTNRRYDGELAVDTSYTQKQLEEAIKVGEFVIHNANGVPRVLSDINALVTLSPEKGADFQNNQTVRVCDQIATDTAALFHARYLGTVPNDSAGRMSLWNDITKLIQELERIRAVEGYDTKILTVEQGADKRAVLALFGEPGIMITSAMSQLYMAVYIA